MARRSIQPRETIKRFLAFLNLQEYKAQNSVVKIKSARITENTVQIICQCVEKKKKTTISGCYIAEHPRSDFPNEKARRCFV